MKHCDKGNLGKRELVDLESEIRYTESAYVNGAPPALPRVSCHIRGTMPVILPEFTRLSFLNCRVTVKLRPHEHRDTVHRSDGRKRQEETSESLTWGHHGC